MYVMLIETCTDISTANQSSVAIHCNLINAPPLEKFLQTGDVLDEPEETNLDTPFCSKQENYTTE